MMNTCRVCGILKDIQLFSPCYMKAKSAICRKCAKEANDRRYIRNNVPADAPSGHRK